MTDDFIPSKMSGGTPAGHDAVPLASCAGTTIRRLLPGLGAGLTRARFSAAASQAENIALLIMARPHLEADGPSPQGMMETVPLACCALSTSIFSFRGFQAGGRAERQLFVECGLLLLGDEISWGLLSRPRGTSGKACARFFGRAACGVLAPSGNKEKLRIAH